MLGMYSNTWTLLQWWRSSTRPRKPEEGGVGSSGQAVTDCSQSHIDHRDSETCLQSSVAADRPTVTLHIMVSIEKSQMDHND